LKNKLVIPRENILKDMLKHWFMALVTMDVAVSDVDIRASGALAVLLIPVPSNHMTHPSAQVSTVLQNPGGKTVVPEDGNAV
jgi:hypothetical protein